jgi:hypothetical protein
MMLPPVLTSDSGGSFTSRSMVLKKLCAQQGNRCGRPDDTKQRRSADHRWI